jgi:hypothetical protein
MSENHPPARLPRIFLHLRILWLQLRLAPKAVRLLWRIRKAEHSLKRLRTP